MKVGGSTSQFFTADDVPGVAGPSTAIAAVSADLEAPESAVVPAVTEQASAANEVMSPPASSNMELSMAGAAAAAATLTAYTTSLQHLPAMSLSAQLPPGPSWHAGTPIVAVRPNPFRTTCCFCPDASSIQARPSSAFCAFTTQGSAFANSCTGSQRMPVWLTSTSSPASLFGEAHSESSSSDANPLAASTQCAAAPQKGKEG